MNKDAMNEIRNILVNDWHNMLFSNSLERKVLDEIREKFTVKEHTGYILVDLGIPEYNNVFIDVTDLINITDALEKGIELIDAIKFVEESD